MKKSLFTNMSGFTRHYQKCILKFELVIVLSVFLIMINVKNAEGYIQNIGMCTNDLQRKILGSIIHHCETREEVVPLDFPLNGSYMQVIPSHVKVQRCAGACSFSRFHSCIPTKTRQREVDVMLIPQSNMGAGAMGAECATAVVEEHVSCGCGCAVKESECRSDKHRFLESECRCVCENDHERAACLSAGKYWSADACMCLCADPSVFHPCPTGFQFDLFDSCSCIPFGHFANTLLEVLLVIITFSMITSILGVAHCYRNKIGLFRKETNEHRGARRSQRIRHESRSSVPITELRTLFRTISHTHSGESGDKEEIIPSLGRNSSCSNGYTQINEETEDSSAPASPETTRNQAGAQKNTSRGNNKNSQQHNFNNGKTLSVKLEGRKRSLTFS